VDYRSALNAHLLPAFGDRPLESIEPSDIEEWRRSLVGLSNRSKNKLLIQMHGVFRRPQIVWGLSVNPLARVEKHPMKASGYIQVFSPEEVWALVRAAASEQDGALFLTAAFTGLRMGELLALRWRDVDFAGSTIRVRASYAGSALTTPKSGKVRAVPLAPDVAAALGAARPARVVAGGGRPGVRGGDRLVSRRLGAPSALQGDAHARLAPTAALPRICRRLRYAWLG
jgi:integrase